MTTGIYVHIKSGNQYELLFEGLMEFNKEEVAIYKRVNSGIVWVRPLLEFQERFKKLK